MASSSANHLPASRYIAILSPSNGQYLTLLPNEGLLAFTASAKARLATHEVVRTAELPRDVVLIRSANGRFWRLATGQSSSIRADRESVPGASDTACHFKTEVIEGGVIAFLAVRNGLYAKRYTSTSMVNGYNAITKTLDVFCQVVVSAANDTALTLPRHLVFKGDNANFMAVHWEHLHHHLKFHKSSADLSCVCEVVPRLDGSISLRSIEVDRFWWRSPDWIWAQYSAQDAASNVDCHFEPVRLSSTMLALKSMANDRYLKRHTDYWVDCLCAVGTSLKDPTTHLTMSEAFSARTLSNVCYLLDLAEVLESELVVVGVGALRNDTPAHADLLVSLTLTQAVTESKSWSNSSTFALGGVTTTFTAGTPFVASVESSISISSSSTITTELGAATENTVEFQTVFTVAQVPPGATARVAIQCQRARCRVPFTYTIRDTRIDGVDLPDEDRIDGIYDGVNAFDILSVASYDGVTAPAQFTLPVEVTRAPLLLKPQ